MVDFGKLGKQLTDRLDSDEGEKKSDDVLDKAAAFLDEKTGGKHADQIAKAREFADEHVGKKDDDRR
ncbi:antitoxin [Geodermatophilus sp. SYSU D00691]